MCSNENNGNSLHTVAGRYLLVQVCIHALTLALSLFPGCVVKFSRQSCRFLVQCGRCIDFAGCESNGTKQLETLTCLLSASNYAKHHVPSQAYLNCLRQVSEDTGVAHTAFLAPPLSRCIIPECQRSLSSDMVYCEWQLFQLYGC